jgi:hypothetical protein
LTEAYHIVCLWDLDVPRMTFAPLCRSLPGLARCLSECHRLSMRLPAIKSEKGRFVGCGWPSDWTLTQDIKEGSYDRNPDFHNGSI